MTISVEIQNVSAEAAAQEGLPMPMSFNKKYITEAQHSSGDATLGVNIESALSTSDIVRGEGFLNRHQILVCFVAIIEVIARPLTGGGRTNKVLGITTKHFNHGHSITVEDPINYGQFALFASVK
uniref:Uncharacterized protein n=1 Tax=Glossina pallidipes TaxID=7398 RepID=A0A1A9ZSR8_GLOPL